MARIYLKETHINLYKGILALALCHYAVGGLIAYSTLKLGAHKPFFAWLFIVLFFVIGTTILYGLQAPHYRFVRWGLIAGLAVIGFLAVIFSLSVSLTLTEEQTVRLAWLVPPWLYWAWAHVLCLKEPPENILTETG